MNKILKSYLWAFVLWVVNIKMFFLASNYEQVFQIYKTSSGVFGFYKNIWIYFYDLIFTIPFVTMVFSIIFSFVLFYFWFTYFKVFFHRLPTAKVVDTGFFGVLSSVVAFLGFGCVACGQTLLTSFLLFFVSSGSTFLVHMVGNLAIVFGIIFLSFGIYKNRKIFENKNICKI